MDNFRRLDFFNILNFQNTVIQSGCDNGVANEPGILGKANSKRVAVATVSSNRKLNRVLNILHSRKRVDFSIFDLENGPLFSNGAIFLKPNEFGRFPIPIETAQNDFRGCFIQIRWRQTDHSLIDANLDIRLWHDKTKLGMNRRRKCRGQ